MGLVEKFRRGHPGLFTYIKSDEIHPHDHMLARTVLRLVPQSVTPNQITMFRIAATPVVFLLILYDFYLFGVVSFLLVAFTDAMDGSIARTRHKITKFGMIFDPLADKLLIGSMVLLLVFEHLEIWLGVTVLGMEIVFIISAWVSAHKFKFKKVHAANRWGKIKMLLQVVAVFLIMLALLLDFPILLSIAAWVFGIAIGFAVLSLFTHGV